MPQYRVTMTFETIVVAGSKNLAKQIALDELLNAFTWASGNVIESAPTPKTMTATRIPGPE